MLATTLRFTACSARAKAGVPHPSVGERLYSPPMEGLQTPLLSDMRTTARQTPLCPQGCASGSLRAWGSSQSACSHYLFPAPAPRPAHRGALEGSRPLSHYPLSSLLLTPPSGFQSDISAVSWGASGHCFLREQEILLHSALGVGQGTSAILLAVDSDPRDRRSAVSTFAHTSNRTHF